MDKYIWSPFLKNDLFAAYIFYGRCDKLKHILIPTAQNKRNSINFVHKSFWIKCIGTETNFTKNELMFKNIL